MSAFIEFGLLSAPRLSEPPRGIRDLAGTHLHAILSEDAFRKILCWERKRAERSSRCFLLMLIHVGKILARNSGDNAISQIVSALSHSTRETDVAGWYLDGQVLGVIFTELGAESGEAFSSATQIRVTSCLEARLSRGELSQTHISFHFFPSNRDGSSLEQGVNVKLYPDLLEEDERRKFDRVVKRTIDIAGSLLALVLSAPLFAFIAIVIKATSKGPVLFKQERIGRYGQRFTFLKFRSMKSGNDSRIHREFVTNFIAGTGKPVAADDQGDAVYKILEDPRITRFGKLLRKTSLDELPQFINVLRGEMSLVGPRPPIPYELETYRAWHRRRVLEVKPGITGLWQVSGRSRTTFDEMVRLDLRYARTWTPWLDIKILLQTPWAVLSAAGAY